MFFGPFYLKKCFFTFWRDFRGPYKSGALGCSLCIKTALKVAPTSNVRGKSERYLNVRVYFVSIFLLVWLSRTPFNDSISELKLVRISICTNIEYGSYPNQGSVQKFIWKKPKHFCDIFRFHHFCQNIGTADFKFFRSKKEASKFEEKVTGHPGFAEPDFCRRSELSGTSTICQAQPKGPDWSRNLRTRNHYWPIVNRLQMKLKLLKNSQKLWYSSRIWAKLLMQLFSCCKIHCWSSCDFSWTVSYKSKLNLVYSSFTQLSMSSLIC